VPEVDKGKDVFVLNHAPAKKSLLPLGWLGLRAGLDAVAKRKRFLPLP
jgi:hypothetical protein